ncbi:DUF3265 domain-containing protein, partial [Vibrio parahaemolyticus]|nr:DUF3265 domain-containing protein [Vibrio parahaemolyticus]
VKVVCGNLGIACLTP